jgi:DNA-directed RNA polymerase specialized sigma24 family protein
MYVEAARHEVSASVVDAPDRSAARWAAETLQIMDDLDSVDRAALRLIYSFGMSQSQVAWELGLPETEIRRSVARGMREVAARLTTHVAWPV